MTTQNGNMSNQLFKGVDSCFMCPTSLLLEIYIVYAIPVQFSPECIIRGSFFIKSHFNFDTCVDLVTRRVFFMVSEVQIIVFQLFMEDTVVGVKSTTYSGLITSGFLRTNNNNNKRIF